MALGPRHTSSFTFVTFCHSQIHDTIMILAVQFFFAFPNAGRRTIRSVYIHNLLISCLMTIDYSTCLATEPGAGTDCTKVDGTGTKP